MITSYSEIADKDKGVVESEFRAGADPQAGSDSDHETLQ
jgi:hypothetical protein